MDDCEALGRYNCRLEGKEEPQSIIVSSRTRGFVSLCYIEADKAAEIQ